MRRFAALAVAFGLFLLGTPSPATAADCQLVDLGLLGLSVTASCDVVDSTGAVVGEVVNGVATIIREVPVPVAPVTVTATVTAPAPAPVTVTQRPAPATSTRTTTATATQTSTARQTTTVTNTSTGQSTAPSATLSPSTVTATVTAVPPRAAEPAQPPGIISNIVPDDPEAAAATGSLLGLFVGIILGVIGLFIAYRRGQIEGEKATLQEFLGVIRGEPEPLTGRHRID